MRLIDTVRRAGRSLKNAKARTLLTSLAIGVGAFTITAALAAGEGGRQYTEEIVSSNTDVRELYVQPAMDETADFSAPQPYNDSPSISYGGGFSITMLTQTDVDTILALEHVESVTPTYNMSALYVEGPNEAPYQAGIEPYHGTIRQDYAAGSAEGLGDNGVIVPSAYQEVLGFASAEAAMGETVTIVIQNAVTFEERAYELTIVGVSERPPLAAMTGSGSIQVSQQLVADMYAYGNAGTPLEEAFLGAVVTVDNEDNVESVKQAIEDAGDYTAQTAEDLMSFLFQFVNVLQGILIGFGALAVLTSVFGIINTQYISVLERTQQIGLMKALGARRRDVGRLFKLEAAWIGFLGGALGAGGALLVGTLANPWISEQLSLGESRLLIFEPLSFVIVVVGLMLVAIGSGILPARKASKLDPIEALRTE